MRGFPKHIATKQDFINLLSDDQFKAEAKKKLQEIYDMKDSKVTRATTLIDPENPEGGWNTEEINNSNSVWKQKGFTGKQEILTLMEKHQLQTEMEVKLK